MTPNVLASVLCILRPGTQQVVAGMNYTIKIKVGDDRHVTIKVYRSLPPISYELKSVEY